MTGEIDIYGLFVPEILVYAAVALVLQEVVCRVLVKLGAHRLVWHPPLVAVSIFVICLGGIVAAASWGRP